MRISRYGYAVCALVLFSVGCQAAGPVAPPASELKLFASPTSPAPPAPPGSINLPTLTGPSRTFSFDHELKFHVTEYTKDSRLVLYDNGAFVLRYASLALDYPGKYTETNGVITFEWAGWSVAGPWGATATLTGDSLTLEYNLIMQLTDFEDAVYVLKPS